MTSPVRYVVSYDFTGFQSANPTIPLPADKLEIELENIEMSIDQTITNLGLVQRSDGKLQNGIVEYESLSNTMKAILDSPVNPRGEWSQSIAYKKQDMVGHNGSTYIAVTDHASSISFNADLSSGKWLLWAGAGSGTTSGTELVVEVNTNTVSLPKALAASDSGKLYINKGATAKNYYTLPTPASDICDFKFANYDADGMRITLPAGVKVLCPGVTTADAGYFDTTTVGATLWLVGVDSTNYVIMSMTGDWDVT